VLLDVQTGVVDLLNGKVCNVGTSLGENVCSCLVVFILGEKKIYLIFVVALEENGFSEQR
jgi:hypothetical protein